MLCRNIAVGNFFLSLLLAGIFLFPGMIFAETLPSGMFVVRPGKVELTMAPGEMKVVNITLTNGTPFPLTVGTGVEDIEAAPQTSPVDVPIALVSQAGASSIKEFLNFSTAPLQLLSGEEVSVPVRIHIPDSAEPGGRYGAIVFEFSSASSNAAGAANIQVKNRIATTFYVRISGDTTEEGKLVAFGLFNNAHHTFSPSGEEPLRFQVAYENTGKVHVNPYGRIVVKSFFGGEHILPIDPWVVLPGATRMREINLTEPLAIGYYTAHLEQNRGYDDIVDEQDTFFFILPSGMQTLLILIGTFLVAFLLYRSLKISRNSVS